MNKKTKIAIACQGGGSHTAFTAGVLKKLLEAVTIRWIRMSEEVTDRLDYTSKLERDAEFIDKLMAEGEKQAEIFCKAD